MTIGFKGQIVTFSDEPSKAVREIIVAMRSAVYQSYPERLR